MRAMRYIAACHVSGLPLGRQNVGTRQSKVGRGQLMPQVKWRESAVIPARCRRVHLRSCRVWVWVCGCICAHWGAAEARGCAKTASRHSGGWIQGAHRRACRRGSACRVVSRLSKSSEVKAHPGETASCRRKPHDGHRDHLNPAGRTATMEGRRKACLLGMPLNLPQERNFSFNLWLIILTRTV